MKGNHNPVIKLPSISLLQKTARIFSTSKSRINSAASSNVRPMSSSSIGIASENTFHGPSHVSYNFRKTSPQKMIVRSDEITAFFKLFDDDVIQDFLWTDCCAKTADKYLLAMVFAYFKRAQYSTKQYTRLNFFTALYLANDMEEDEEDDKYDIFPWALGRNWRNTYPGFLRKRDKLLRAIQYRAAVSRKCCEEVMSLAPDHIIWKRERMPHHAGAVRKYPDPDEDTEAVPMGPDATPVHCDACEKAGSFAFNLEIQQGPDSGFLYLSSCTESSSDDSTESIEEMDAMSCNKLEDLPIGLPLKYEDIRDCMCDEATMWASRDE